MTGLHHGRARYVSPRIVARESKRTIADVNAPVFGFLMGFRATTLRLSRPFGWRLRVPWGWGSPPLRDFPCLTAALGGNMVQCSRCPRPERVFGRDRKWAVLASLNGRLFYFCLSVFFGGITPAFLRMTLSAWRLNFPPRRIGSSVTSFGGIFTMPSASRRFFPRSPNFATNVS